MIILSILLWIAGILGLVGIPSIIIFVPLGIYFLVKASNEQDPIVRKSKNKKGIVFMLLPFGMIILGLLMLVAIHLIIKP